MDGCGQDAPGLPSKTQRAAGAAVSGLMTIDQKVQAGQMSFVANVALEQPQSEGFDEQKRGTEVPPLPLISPRRSSAPADRLPSLLIVTVSLSG